MKFLANGITSILHPVTITIPGVFLIVYSSTGNFHSAFYWSLLSLVFSAFVSLFVLFGVKKGFFNNLDVSNRKQRVILYPFVIVTVFLFALAVHFLRGPFTLIVSSFLMVFSLLILDAINSKIKASIHVAAVSSLVVGVVYLFGGASYLLVFLIPLEAWARIYEKRHTLQETIVGAVSGIVLSVFAIFIVQLVIRIYHI